MAKTKQKNVDEGLEKLKVGVQEIFNFDPNNLRDCNVNVYKSGDTMTVEVSQMYEHLPLTFDTLMKLSVLFGTKDFTVNQWSHRGCETCDYGSNYTHEKYTPKMIEFDELVRH